MWCLGLQLLLALICMSEVNANGDSWTPTAPTMAVDCRSSDYDIKVTFSAAATDFEQLNEIKIAEGAVVDQTADTCTAEDIQVTTDAEVVETITNLYGTGTEPGCGNGADFLDDDGTKIEYTTGVLVTIRQRKDKLQRYYNYKFNVKCTLERDGKVKSEQTFSVVNSEPENAVAEEESGTFVLGVAMNFLKDTGDNQEATFTVKNNELLRVSVKETAVDAKTSDPDLKFTVQKCFVSNKPTADDNSADLVKADIIDNECGIDDTIKLTAGGEDQSEFKFEARAFSLVTPNIDAQLCIHCEIFVCRKDEVGNVHGGKCIQACNAGKRRRRDLGDETNDAERKEVVSSSQTFAFTDHVFSTQCPPGFVFDRVSEKCTQQRLVAVKGIHLKGQWINAYANSSTPEFRGFARSIEHQLHALMTATNNQEEIRGIAITEARQGSLPGRIIIDVLISHSGDEEPEAAFFTLKKVLYRTSPQVTRLVNLVNVDREQTVDLVHVGMGGAMGLNVNVLVIVVVVVVLAVVLVCGFVSCQMVKKRRSSAPVTNGVDNIAMEKGMN